MIKSIIQGFLRRLNIQVYTVSGVERLKEFQEEQKRIKTLWLQHMQIRTIIDIGANTGQFASHIHEIIPNAMLYAFEPLQDCYEELVINLTGVMQFKAFNLALGNESGTTEIHRSEYSLSSSLLPMAELHKESFPFTRNETIQVIQVAKLDEIAHEMELQKPLMIKIDVQGFEDKVIAGGLQTITQADIIIVEMSIEPLYEGQSLFYDIYKTLIEQGFQYRGNYDQLCNPNDGRVLQVDGIFVKP